jgi:hypothetical protein
MDNPDSLALDESWQNSREPFSPDLRTSFCESLMVYRLTSTVSQIQFCRSPDFYDPNTPDMSTPCKHPRVRVVAREEDAEYVECLECGEVFDSNEFQDMAIEESVAEDEEEE